MRVISIQSQVVHGHVGNSAAVFPMQARGIEVAAIPTAILSNTPHYPSMHGRILEPGFVASLVRGIEELGLVDTATILLTGYLGSVKNAVVIAEFIARAKRRNPRLRYVCDPVMGDADIGIFVSDGLLDAFGDRLLPMADIVTPNQFEFELLAGCRTRTARSISKAAGILCNSGTRDVVVTGFALDDSADGTVETVLHTSHGLHRFPVPRLPIRPAGTGDLFTALLVTELCRGRDLASACGRATAEVFTVLERTRCAETIEMKIVGHPAWTSS